MSGVRGFKELQAVLDAIAEEGRRAHEYRRDRDARAYALKAAPDMLAALERQLHRVCPTATVVEERRQAWIQAGRVTTAAYIAWQRAVSS